MRVRALNTMLPYVIIVLGFLLIYSKLLTGQSRSRENNARVRVDNCILSKNAKNRSQDDIEVCYTVIENDTGVHLKRYDQLEQ